MATERLSREARRDLILEAATEVFGRLGYEATRMDDVAKVAGIAKGLLYKHFQSKDALFEALIARQARNSAAELRRALAGADLTSQPMEALRSGLALWLRDLGDERAPFNFSDPGAHDAYDVLRIAMREVIAEAIVAAEPAVAEEFAKLLAALIQGAAENLGVVWRTDPSGITEDLALELLAQFCWGGIERLRTLL